MKFPKTSLLIFLSSIGLSHFVVAQVKLPITFQESLEQMELSIAIPVEQSYKNKRIKRNDFFKPDHVIKSRRNRIEIQYALLPQDIYPDLIPTVYSAITISNIASNENTKATIVVHDIDDEILLSSFNADWGNIAYFQPKYSFSKYKHGKLLSLYREDKGMIYVLFLFDDDELEEVDQQYFAVRFR